MILDDNNTYKIPPKETIRELLKTSGVSNREIEKRLTSFERIGNKEAIEFSKEFNIPISFFINLQFNYDKENKKNDQRK